MKKLLAFLISFLLIMSLFIIECSAALKTVDGIMYEVVSDGSLGHKYTGWATSKSTGNKYYYKNGVRLTGVNVFKDGMRYVFDENGVLLLKRTSSGKYNVISDNSYYIKIKDGFISFEVKVNTAKVSEVIGANMLGFSAGPHFSLYIYKDGKWKAVPYKEGYGADDYALGLSEENTFCFKKELTNFDFNFEPGLYRVKCKVGNGDRDDNNKYIWTDVRGEFNLI